MTEDEQDIFDDLAKKIDEIYDDYVFETMRRGRQFKFKGVKYGCGCRTCYIQGKEMYEWAFPEESEYLSYDDVPEWLLIKEYRTMYRNGEWKPPEF